MYEARFVKGGNIKIGPTMWSFNKLAGAGEFLGCKGSCGNYCKGCYNKDNPRKSSCYVFSSYNRYPSVITSHVRNTNAIRNNIDKSFEEMDKQILRAKKKPSAIRIHSSGEIESSKELRKWMILAEKYPNIPFYIYTKNYNAVNRALLTKEVPKNFYINISIWHENGIECYNKWKTHSRVRAFVYDDGYSYPNSIKKDCHCPAYDEKGKMNHNMTCDKCKICFSNKNKVCYCHDH